MFEYVGADSEIGVHQATLGEGVSCRIVISANSSWNVINFRAGLIRTLINAGHEVVAAAPADEHSARIADLGCRYVPLPIDRKGTSPHRDLVLFARYVRLMRRERPHVYLGYTIKPNIYGSLAAHACGVPTINTVSGLGTAFISDTWITRVARQLYRRAFARSHTVFFHNEDDLRLFVDTRLVAGDRAALVPGSGIDTSKFRPEKRAVNRNGFCFLLVARLLWDKGIGEFVEAARRVRREVPEARFQLLGPIDSNNRSAVDRASLDRWASEGLVEYLGVRDDVRSAIAAADCVVLPSYREGLPRSLLEAAAMAKPLIATDVPGCRQLVKHDENGLLCRVRDDAHLSERMLALIAMSPERREAMGRAGRAKAEQEFDEAAVISRYLATVAEAATLETAPEVQGTESRVTP